MGRSSIGSVVFTSSDYQELVGNASYIAAIKGLFSSAVVLFLGYGLQDKYLLKLIADTEGSTSCFGMVHISLSQRSPAPGTRSASHSVSNGALSRPSNAAQGLSSSLVTCRNQIVTTASSGRGSVKHVEY
jgi:hypothetical protein